MKHDLYQEAVAKLRQAIQASGWERAVLLHQAVQLHVRSLEEADDEPEAAPEDGPDRRDFDADLPRRGDAA